MTRDEIVTALRCCEQHKKCEGTCPLIAEVGCIEKAMGYAASLCLWRGHRRKICGATAPTAGRRWTEGIVDG